MEERKRKTKLMYLAVLVSFFYVNDFLFMPVRNYLEWLSVDYTVRIAAIAVILYVIKKNLSTPQEFGLVKIGLKQGLIWSVLLSVVGVAIDQWGAGFLKNLSPIFRPATFPTITNPYVKIFDLTAGIALVSVTEELIFRGYFYTVLKDVMKNPGVMIAVSSILFGLSHWSGGLNIIITATLWAVLPMYVMRRTGSVVPALVAHFVTDFVAFV